MANDKRRHLLREKILTAARDVFLDKGFAGAKIGDIAKAAGVSISTLYLYFSGKKELFSVLDMPQATEHHPEQEKKQAEIVKTALAVFGEKGFENTTMEDIAERAGASKATLYQFCTGKEDLLLQTLDYFIATGVQQPQQSRADLTDWREYFRVAGQECIGRSSDPGRNAFLGAVIRDSKKFPAFGRAYFDHSYQPARDGLVGFLRKHQEAGHVRTDVDLTATADVFLGILMSYVVLFRLVGGIENNQVDAEAYINRATEIFVNDLEVKGAPE